jgi:hypothetical protein
VTAARELDECGERVIPLELNRGSGGRWRERVSPKERIRASEDYVASEGLMERDDRKRAGKEPRGRGCRGDGDRDYKYRNPGSDQAKTRLGPRDGRRGGSGRLSRPELFAPLGLIVDENSIIGPSDLRQTALRRLGTGRPRPKSIGAAASRFIRTRSSPSLPDPISACGCRACLRTYTRSPGSPCGASTSTRRGCRWHQGACALRARYRRPR